ncbi:hypothetical protein RQP46_009517 [Phenoliferia psychrophenolica]
MSLASTSAPAEAACADDDSDDDSDLALPHLPSATSALHPVHTVDITAHSYWTYRGVLSWTTSSHILFAPLTSTFSPTESSSAPDLRREWIKTSILENAESGSVPVSPKSVYRLAHFLELDALKSIALSAIKSNLCASNVLQELLGETASAYEEIREVEMKYALGNWAEVKKQEGAKELLGRMDDGSTEGILLKLAMGLCL